MARWLVLSALLCVRAAAEFVYYDFNSTTGLVLNGDAATSSCVRVARNEYSARTGKGDVREAAVDAVYHQRLESVVTETTTTEDPRTSPRIALEAASVGHRDAFVQSNDEQRCAVRLRLTPSQPRQLAAVWYADALPVLQGFDTRFTFQISDQSKRCYEVVDENFGLRHYRSCVVHGGDGLAFVVHGHANKTDALGTSIGSGLGVSGLTNSLAIQFDTWYNGELPDDVFEDHVAVYVRVGGATQRVSTSALQDLADGRIHAVKIRYYNELRDEYAPFFSATTSLTRYLKDISEGRRIGTLVVFLDDGIASDTPLLALPINLAATLRLATEHAVVGFTASTGLSWQKHDVLGWYYCTQPPCLDEHGTETTFEFDYNQQSMVSAASHGTRLYPIYIYPDTTPWAKKQSYVAAGQQIGVFPAP